MNQSDSSGNLLPHSQPDTTNQQPSNLSNHLSYTAPKINNENSKSIDFGTDPTTNNTEPHNIGYIVSKTVKDKRTTCVPTDELDTVKKRLVFDNIIVNPENSEPRSTNTNRRRNNNGLGQIDINIIKKMR